MSEARGRDKMCQGAITPLTDQPACPLAYCNSPSLSNFECMPACIRSTFSFMHPKCLPGLMRAKECAAV